MPIPAAPVCFWKRSRAKRCGKSNAKKAGSFRPFPRWSIQARKRLTRSICLEHIAEFSEDRIRLHLTVEKGDIPSFLIARLRTGGGASWCAHALCAKFFRRRRSRLVPAAHDLLGIRLLPGMGVLKGTHHSWHGLPLEKNHFSILFTALDRAPHGQSINALAHRGTAD